MSPLRTANRSSSIGSASFTGPAVPSGSGSSTYRIVMPSRSPDPSTLRTPAARNPHDITMSSNPWYSSQSSMYEMNGRLASGTTGFGTLFVSGRNRVPSPPARISACIRARE